GDDRIDARAIRQASIDHRALAVNLSADGLDDLLDHLADVIVVAELDVCLLELALALGVDQVRAVDHHFADARVVEQALDRAEVRLHQVWIVRYRSWWNSRCHSAICNACNHVASPESVFA